MKLAIDQNNLLVIENPNIPQSKEYNYNVGGYEFSSFDKGLVIYHKKQFKIINMKDLGDKMGVVVIDRTKNKNSNEGLSIYALDSAIETFMGFDEDSGENYAFLYKFPENKLDELNKKLKLLGSNNKFTRTDKGIYCPVTQPKEYKMNSSIENAISFLLGLCLIYGNININGGILKSIKMQIPLFGIYIGQKTIINNFIKILVFNKIFLKTSTQETNDGIIYQITSSDFELLQIFARFYEPIEKGLEISKYTDTLKIKEELLEFLKTNNEIPDEGKSDVLNEIENGMIKVLVK